MRSATGTPGFNQSTRVIRLAGRPRFGGVFWYLVKTHKRKQGCANTPVSSNMLHGTAASTDPAGKRAVLVEEPVTPDHPAENPPHYWGSFGSRDFFS